MTFVSASQFHVYLLWGHCLNSVLNMKAVVAAFNQEKALVGAFSVITNFRMQLFEALVRPGPAHAAATISGLRLDIEHGFLWSGQR